MKRMLTVAALALAAAAAAVATSAAAAAEPGATAGTAAALELRTAAGQVKIEPWGQNALRVRAALGADGVVQDLPGALIKPGSDNKGAPLAGAGAATTAAASSEVSVTAAGITNGNIAATVGDDGLVTVTRVSDGATVLQELAREMASPPAPPPAPKPPVGNVMTIAVNNSAAACCESGGACCLDVANWNTKDNAPVLVSNCHYDLSKQGFLNQRWSLDTSDGTIKVALDGKCLTAASSSAVTVATCKAGDATQRWEAAAAAGAALSPGVGPLKNNGKCLTMDAKGAKGGCGETLPRPV
jgi:hypothetical protein